jgi:putative ABC transport system permease protein
VLRNYLATALRNLGRHRLHSAITLASLVIGFTAALMAAVIWRYETNYDRFWPNAERLYLVGQWIYGKDGQPVTSDASGSLIAGLIRESVPDAETVVRLGFADMELTRGQVSAREEVRWADPNFFEVLKPKAVAGNLSTALARPGSLVMTKTLARKYFGDADPIGQTVLSGPEPLQVTAVIEDLPSNTHLNAEAFLSGTAAASPFNDPKGMVFTYVLARPGANPALLTKAIEGLVSRLPPDYAPTMARGAVLKTELKLLPLPQVYMKPPGYGVFQGGRRTFGLGSREGDRPSLYVAAGIAGIILAVAAINFITLMTARGAGRAVEVGVRKAAGARRSHLVAQFVGEALIFALLAVFVALAALELVLPAANALMETHLAFSYLDDLALTSSAIGAAVLIGGLAGLYPALALSAYRPAVVLKGGRARTPGSARLRQVLVAVQFVPLILLGLAATASAVRLERALDASYRMLDPDALLISEPCKPALKDRLAALPGVALVACVPTQGWRSSNNISALHFGVGSRGEAQTVRGQTIDIEAMKVTPEMLRFHGIKPLAGRLLTDNTSVGDGAVLNETAARRLGFSNPQAAVGSSITWSPTDNSPKRTSTIIGVTAARGGQQNFETALYTLDPDPNAPDPRGMKNGYGLKLTGKDTAATLAAIDRAWTETGGTRPMNRAFYGERIDEMAQENRRTAQLFFAIVGVGVLVATLGLYGVSAFLAEQRTKEIGVRKAMGANRLQVLRMLLFQFVRPVLIANLIACPLAFIAGTLLQQQVDVDERFPMGPQIFAPIILGSLAVAILATFVHAWRVTAARPVAALRYE